MTSLLDEIKIYFLLKITDPKLGHGALEPSVAFLLEGTFLEHKHYNYSTPVSETVSLFAEGKVKITL